MKWEYMTASISSDEEVAVHELDMLGKLRWEMCGVEGGRTYFKRELKEDKEEKTTDLRKDEDKKEWEIADHGPVKKETMLPVKGYLENVLDCPECKKREEGEKYGCNWDKGSVRCSRELGHKGECSVFF